MEEAHKNAFEKERREIVARKRDREREDFYRRLEEAQQKLIVAQNNLEKVLQKHQQEKKVTFKESSPTKVCDYFQITSLLHFLHEDSYIIYLLTMPMFLHQTNGTTPDVKSIAKKSKNVQKALEEIQKREDQLKKLHDKEHQGKESGAQKRKEEMEQKIKDKILSANR